MNIASSAFALLVAVVVAGCSLVDAAARNSWGTGNSLYPYVDLNVTSNGYYKPWIVSVDGSSQRACHFMVDRSSSSSPREKRFYLNHVTSSNTLELYSCLDHNCTSGCSLTTTFSSNVTALSGLDGESWRFTGDWFATTSAVVFRSYQNNTHAKVSSACSSEYWNRNPAAQYFNPASSDCLPVTGFMNKSFGILDASSYSSAWPSAGSSMHITASTSTQSATQKIYNVPNCSNTATFTKTFYWQTLADSCSTFDDGWEAFDARPIDTSSGMTTVLVYHSSVVQTTSTTTTTTTTSTVTSGTSEPPTTSDASGNTPPPTTTADGFGNTPPPPTTTTAAPSSSAGSVSGFFVALVSVAVAVLSAM